MRKPDDGRRDGLRIQIFGCFLSNADRLKNRVADKNTVKEAVDAPQTGNNPAHHIVELPKPVAEEVVKKLNEIFKLN